MEALREVYGYLQELNLVSMLVCLGSTVVMLTSQYMAQYLSLIHI